MISVKENTPNGLVTEWGVLIRKRKTLWHDNSPFGEVAVIANAICAYNILKNMEIIPEKRVKKWLKGIKDKQTLLAILARLEQASKLRNLGDCKRLGSSLFEMRYTKVRGIVCILFVKGIC